MQEQVSIQQWEKMNQIIYDLYRETDVRKLRRTFLVALELLIPHEKSFFDLGYKKNTKVVFFDPVTANIEEEYMNSFFSEYIFADTMFWFFSQEKSDIYRESDYVTKPMQDASAFYHGWVYPQNLMFSMGACVAMEGHLYGTVNLWRGEKAGDFTNQELEIMRILNQHLCSKFYSMYPKGLSKKNDDNYIGTLSEIYHLTARETEVANLIYEGMSIKEISNRLFISESTVKKHSHNLFIKMDIANRAQMIKKIHHNRAEVEKSLSK